MTYQGRATRQHVLSQVPIKYVPVFKQELRVEKVKLGKYWSYFLHVSLLSINNSNVSTIFSIFLLEVTWTFHSFLYSGWCDTRLSSQQMFGEQKFKRHHTINCVTMV